MYFIHSQNLAICQTISGRLSNYYIDKNKPFTIIK